MKQILLVLLSMMALTGHAQASGTVPAASCKLSDVQAALNLVTATTTLVTIPEGTCDWNGNLTWTVPAGNTNLTIQGQSTVNCTGTPGTSTYACTAVDKTIIRDSFSSGSGQSPWMITMSGGAASACSFRMTGMTVEGGTGNAKNNGIIEFHGPCDNFRIDHSHFNMTTYTPAFSTFPGRLFGEFEGVIDHNIYDNGSGTVSQGFILSNPIGDSIGFGDGTWSNPTGFGTSAFMFIEDNVMNGGELEDCDSGGKFVARYNSILNGSNASAAIHAHGTKTPGSRIRGCRAYEAYHNYINASPGHDAAMGSAGGASLLWGNTLAAGYNWLAANGASRNDGSEVETNTPNGWGYCGTSTNSNGTGSPWDGTQSSTGYPCLDGVGRGQGQPLNGKNFPNAVNATTGTISWPHQYLEPVYYFDNTILNGASQVRVSDASSQLNRDVYVDNATFNGSSGTGSGPLASRPATCTAGPGGTYGQSPTGSYGVAYWATDANSGNGELYVCTSTNTWTAVYQPYVYPHPLVSGNPTTTAQPPSPPTNLTATVQ
jgi:hypothetical protein